ncbi:MAG: hypothetical protein IIA83_11455 [Thaumarchaeota archaeon]|nr:hypothetical protein [Nitrososphaerota archaeon]
MPQTKPIVSVENVVASASVDQKLDLIEITKKFPDTEYHPEQFPGLIHRMLDPKTAILLFALGKLVCTGAKKESDVYRSVHNLHALLEEKDLMIYE